jgi:hypothetical protein
MLWPKEKAKRTNNDLQNITQKLKMKATRTPINTGEGDEVRCTGSVGSSCFTCDTVIKFSMHNKHIFSYRFNKVPNHIVL